MEKIHNPFCWVSQQVHSIRISGDRERKRGDVFETLPMPLFPISVEINFGRGKGLNVFFSLNRIPLLQFELILEKCWWWLHFPWFVCWNESLIKSWPIIYVWNKYGKHELHVFGTFAKMHIGRKGKHNYFSIKSIFSSGRKLEKGACSNFKCSFLFVGKIHILRGNWKWEQRNRRKITKRRRRTFFHTKISDCSCPWHGPFYFFPFLGISNHQLVKNWQMLNVAHNYRLVRLPTPGLLHVIQELFEPLFCLLP